jgi:hypothetical protein
MTDDLVWWLRNLGGERPAYVPELYDRAADRIEELEKALRRIEESEEQFSMQWAAEIARAALKGETE